VKTIELLSFADAQEIRTMKRLVLIFVAIATFFFSAPAFADADIATGAKVFSANCAACHNGGMNVVNAAKNLKLETLKQYGMDSKDAIITQVINGKNGMPAFKGRLNQDQIESVAAYVLARADGGWK
jgi:cytochrome c6